MIYNILSNREKGNIMDILNIQEFLNQIDGIESCKILGNENEILEIHILSEGSRSPKQISRDIETAIMTRYDVRIDRKIISIVQFKGTEAKLKSRIRLTGVSVSSHNNLIEVEVKLAYEENEYYFKQIGVNTLSNKNRLVAEATLKVVEEILGQAHVVYINDVIVKDLPDCSIVTSIVTFKLNCFEEILVGSAVMRNDINESIARATLDAINRRVKDLKL